MAHPRIDFGRHCSKNSQCAELVIHNGPHWNGAKSLCKVNVRVQWDGPQHSMLKVPYSWSPYAMYGLVLMPSRAFLLGEVRAVDEHHIRRDGIEGGADGTTPIGGGGSMTASSVSTSGLNCLASFMRSAAVDGSVPPLWRPPEDIGVNGVPLGGWRKRSWPRQFPHTSQMSESDSTCRSFALRCYDKWGGTDLCVTLVPTEATQASWPGDGRFAPLRS